MDKKKIFAILLIAIATSSVLLLGANKELAKTVEDDLDLGQDAQYSVIVDFYGYFDGEKVTVPIVAAPWSIGGQIVDELAVNVSWTASGAFMDWTTLLVIGSLKIYKLNYAGVREDITSNIGASLLINKAGTSAMVDSVEFVLPLSVLLGGVPITYADADGEYWDIQLVIQLNAQVIDNYDGPWEDDTGELLANVKIWNAAEGLKIDGKIT